MDAVGCADLPEGSFLMLFSSSVTKLPVYRLISLQLMTGHAIKTHFPTLIELLVPKCLTFSWLNVSILMQSFFLRTHYHILINISDMLYYSSEKFAMGQMGGWINGTQVRQRFRSVYFPSR